MNIKIIVFSQTGNTRKVAKAMKEVLKEGSHTVQNISMRKIEREDIGTADLIGIGCPTFECQAPTPVKTFLKSLPEMTNQKAFVFATGAGAPGKVIKDLTTLLNSKGADVVGKLWTRSIIHFPAPCLVGKSSNHPNQKDLDEAKCFALAVAGHVQDGNLGRLSNEEFNSGKSRFGFYNLVGAITSNKGLVRLLLPEPILDQDKCDKCEFCNMECPVNNIRMDDYPVIDAHCIRCYRCLNGCHKKAFNANWQIGNLVCFALYNETFLRWFGDYD